MHNVNNCSTARLLRPAEFAYRIEWKGRGPFWDVAAMSELVRLCRQTTPRWKAETPDCSSFLEYYIAYADSPYDDRRMAPFMDRIGAGHGFAFTSLEVMQREFGLHVPVYREQFEKLLERQPRLVLRAYLVRPLVSNSKEMLFLWKDAELVEELSEISRLRAAA